MIKVENECCDCATASYPCLGDACHLRHVEHFYCDDCGDETTLYDFDGEQLCIYCIEKRLEVIEGSDE